MDLHFILCSSRDITTVNHGIPTAISGSPWHFFGSPQKTNREELIVRLEKACRLHLLFKRGFSCERTDGKIKKQALMNKTCALTLFFLASIRKNRISTDFQTLNS
jgi:hypothetical protein